MPKIILVPTDENMANARIMDAAGPPALFSAVNSADFVAYYATGLSVVAQAAPESGATSEDVTITNFVIEDGIATITISEPPEYAGTHTATIADLDDGPVNIVPASVTEDGGTYTATPGLWITGEDDPALYSYEWRSGSITWGEGDGVSVDGLSFTPVDQEPTFDLRGLQLHEAAANIAGTRATTVTGRAARELIAVNYSPTRQGMVKSTIHHNDDRQPEYSVILRYRPLAEVTGPADEQALFGSLNTWARLRLRAGGVNALGFSVRSTGATSFDGNALSTATTFESSPALAWAPGNWQSFIFSADRQAGFPDSRAVIAGVNKTTILTGQAATPDPEAVLVQPRWIGSAKDVNNSNWEKIANGDFAPFVAIFEGHAFDPNDEAVWDEVFDPLDDYNFRPEYLDGSKITVGGVTPTVVLRGPGLLLGENAVPDGPAWEVDGVLQEPVFAP